MYSKQFKAYESRKRSESGIALVATFFLISVLSALLAAYLVVTRIELATMKASKDSMSGFYAAEAGLNLRAETIRETFIGYNTPTGTSPDLEATPCEAGNVGSGSFECDEKSLNGRSVRTYVIDHQPGEDPPMIRIPQGELYQNLNAQEYRYTASAEARGSDDKTEAILQLRFKSRLVPMFQFAAFYDKDLEILPGPTMNLSGPVHTNGDLYLNSDNTVNISGQVSAAGTIFRGRKNDSTCGNSRVRVLNPTVLTHLVPTCPSRTQVNATHVAPFNGMIQFAVDSVAVPEPEILDPYEGNLYWDKADLRIVLRVDASGNPVTTNVSSGIEVRSPSNAYESAATTTLFGCTGRLRRNPAAGDNNLRAAGTTNAFYNNREAETIRMLDIDMIALFNCLHSSNWFGTSKGLDDDTEGGLVFYFTVEGPQSTSTNNRYGVRISNGQQLRSTVGGAPLVKGITIVSDQAVYVQGNYNSTNKIPAAVLSDTFNVLSNYWYDTAAQVFRDNLSTQALGNRPPTDTTQNLAVLAGTDTTGGVEGAGGQGGAYNGGLENYPRFHENWTGRTYTYRGSFVSLNRPRHQNGTWVYGSTHYTAPNRNWDYDVSFNNAANLPPITPRFVFLRQELFVRDFEQ